MLDVHVNLNPSDPTIFLLINSQLSFRSGRDHRCMCGLEGFDVADEHVEWTAKISCSSKAAHDQIVQHINDRQKILVDEGIALMKNKITSHDSEKA